MARGNNFAATYGDRTIGGGAGAVCQGDGPADIGLAQFVLDSFNIPNVNVVGDPSRIRY